MSVPETQSMAQIFINKLLKKLDKQLEGKKVEGSSRNGAVKIVISLRKLQASDFWLETSALSVEVGKKSFVTASCNKGLIANRTILCFVGNIKHLTQL
jgi:hypothetical protein